MTVDDDGAAPMSAADLLLPHVRPPWLGPLVDNVDRVPDAYRRRVPPELVTALALARDAAPHPATPLCWCCSPVRMPSTRRAGCPTMPTC